MIPGVADADQIPGVVLAAAWGLSLLSGAMLLIQAFFEIGVTMYIRYSPKVPE